MTRTLGWTRPIGGWSYDLAMPERARPGRRFAAVLLALLAVAAAARAEKPQDTGGSERSFLYVAVPGIRNYVEFGGIGLLVFDRDDGYKFVKRIPTWPVLSGEQPENVKGIAASARDGRVYVTTIKRIAAFDVVTEKKVWEATPEGGCDRLAISPDGRLLYVPSFEGPHWNVLEAATGETVARIDPNSRAHNTALRARRSRRVPGGAGLAAPVGRRPADPPGRQDGRAVLAVDPAVHRQRQADARLRQRQRAARLRDRRPQERQEAPPRRGAGLPEGARPSATAARATASA